MSLGAQQAEQQVMYCVPSKNLNSLIDVFIIIVFAEKKCHPFPAFLKRPSSLIKPFIFQQCEEFLTVVEWVGQQGLGGQRIAQVISLVQAA